MLVMVPFSLKRTFSWVKFSLQAKNEGGVKPPGYYRYQSFKKILETIKNGFYYNFKNYGNENRFKHDYLIFTATK